MGSLFEADPQVNTSTSEHYQQDYYDKLLGNADSWLDNANKQPTIDYTNQMKDLLAQTGQGYLDMATGAGTGDRYQALQDLNAASAAQAGQALGGELNSIGLGAAGTGTANSSRRGVAEGVATANANTALAAQQAAQNQQFLNDETSIRQQGLSGLGNMFGQIGALQQNAQANTSSAQQLKNLLAYQQLISGNMGGTTTGTAEGGGPSLGSQILGAGTSLGGAWLMSDKNKKQNIKVRKAKTKKGNKIASYEWKDDSGKKGTSTGVIAQDVKKKNPKAVRRSAMGQHLEVKSNMV